MTRTMGWVPLVGMLASSPLPAQDDDFDATIRYRQGLMKAQGGHMAALSQIVRGRIPDPEHRYARIHAEALVGTLTDLERWFPEGSDFGETRADERIWDQWAAFRKAAEDARRKARALLTAVGQADRARVARAFKAMGDACKACHKDFRTEED